VPALGLEVEPLLAAPPSSSARRSMESVRRMSRPKENCTAPLVLRFASSGSPPRRTHYTSTELEVGPQWIMGRHKADAQGHRRRYPSTGTQTVRHAAIDAGRKTALNRKIVKPAAKKPKRIALAISFRTVQAKIGNRYSAIDRCLSTRPRCLSMNCLRGKQEDEQTEP
jgi:hypothetical protein